MSTQRIFTSQPGGFSRASGKPPLPDPPKKRDMEQFINYNRAAIGNTLYRHFAHRPDVLIGGESYICFERRQPQSEWLWPDLLFAFGVNPEVIIPNNGYEIEDAGKPPDLVMEVASKTTGRRDYTVKRVGYAGFGIGEYWRFDYTGGEYHDAPLAGDLLVNGRYERIPLTTDDPGKRHGMLSGYSPVLDLYLCWDNGKLRFYDPKTDEFLLDPAELEAALAATEADRDAIQAERDAANERIRQLEAQLRDNHEDA